MLKDTLKDLREKKHLTKKQAAESIGITERAYIAYEYGERDVSTDTLIKIADYYGVTTDYLLGREQPTLSPIEQLSKRLDLTLAEQAIVTAYLALDAEKRTELVELVEDIANRAKGEKEKHTATCGVLEEARKSEEEAS